MAAGKFDGEVDVGETYICGKARNMHAGKRRRLQLSPKKSMVGEVAVMISCRRHGDGSKVRTLV